MMLRVGSSSSGRLLGSEALESNCIAEYQVERTVRGSGGEILPDEQICYEGVSVGTELV